MAKSRPAYVCESCGAQSPKWAGQCPDCGEWNTLTEALVSAPAGKSPRSWLGAASEVQRLDQVGAEDTPRTATGLAEMDRVLVVGSCLGR